jgi:hypothetical protein
MPGIFDYLFGPKDAREELNSGGVDASMQPTELPQALPQPYGGMVGSQLDDYIKAHPGPNALSESTPSQNRSPASPQPAPPVNKLIENGKRIKELEANPVQNAAPIGQVLAKLTGQEPNELRDAQQQRNQLQLMAILGRAGQQAGAAIANRADIKPDDEGYRTLLAAAEQPISDIKTEKALAAETSKNKKLAAEAKTAEQQSDPTSDVSQIARDLYEKTMHKKAPPNASAAQLKDMDNVFARIFAAEENRKDRQDNKKLFANQKRSAEQSKAYTALRERVESFRGNAKAQQASKDVLAADKALQMVEHKDPNSLTMQDLRLLSEELGKIASGGVPGEHGVQQLMPNNLKTKFAEMQNFMLSKPSDAQAGEYIARNMEYLKDMRGVAQNALDSYQLNIAKGYKNRVSSDDWDEFKSDYPTLFNKSENEHSSNEVERLDPKSGKIVVYDAKTKKPIRWK